MTQEPCDFVKLVLNRMDSNPDEFEHYGRWSTLCIALERYAGAANDTMPIPDRNVLWAYDQFEVDLMLAKYREIYRDREYKSMLKSLLVGAEPKAEGYLIRDAKNMASSTKGVGSGLISKAALQQTALNQLNSSFDETYRNAVGSTGQQYAANTATSMGLNPQLRAQMDDMIEAKMRGLDRG
jgi:hypothetical protein